jgi:hypothetical protein
MISRPPPPRAPRTPASRAGERGLLLSLAKRRQDLGSGAWDTPHHPQPFLILFNPGETLFPRALEEGILTGPQLQTS